MHCGLTRKHPCLSLGFFMLWTLQTFSVSIEECRFLFSPLLQTFFPVTWRRSKPSAALSAAVIHDLDRAEKQLLLEHSFVGRREEVKGSALTFGGVCPGSFTMPWKLNTVCDIYCLWWSVDTVLQWMEMAMSGNELEKQVSMLNTMIVLEDGDWNEDFFHIQCNIFIW